jgi:hypothetical protein
MRLAERLPFHREIRISVRQLKRVIVFAGSKHQGPGGLFQVPEVSHSGAKGAHSGARSRPSN